MSGNQSLPGRETILLVEDDEVVRTLTARMLRGQGYHVITAEDGYEALLTVRDLTSPVDLLITDVVMPGMSGSELGNRLAAQMPTLKVLYVSGYLKKGESDRDLVGPNAPFLQKPYPAAALAEKVREMLGSPPVAAAR